MTLTDSGLSRLDDRGESLMGGLTADAQRLADLRPAHALGTGALNDLGRA